MKKTILSIAVIAAAIFAASCQKESLQDNAATEGSTSVFTATIETVASTKTTAERVDGTPVIYKTKWDDGDEIIINGKTFTATPSSDATKATFTKKNAGDTDPTATFKAYFPKDLSFIKGLRLPETYTYADGKYNMPMYAESDNTTLSFKNLCGVLAITVSGADFSSVSSIEVSSDQQMNGAFTATADGVLSFASVALTDDLKKVTLTFASAKTIASDGSATFYLPVPAGTHNPLTIKVSDGTTTKTMVTKKSGGVAVARNTVYPIAFADNSSPSIPDGALSGVFSVSATKKVYFSQGNLWYDGSAFKFEENQYDFQSIWDPSHVSHFHWSKDASVARAETYSESGTAMTDVIFTDKANFTVNGVTGKYRTFSSGEWDYLYNTTSRMVYEKACNSNFVSGISIGGSTYYGVFLYPDDYNGEVVSSSMTWEQINAAGIVFIPAAGYRGGSSFYSVNSSCNYWTSNTYNSTSATSVTDSILTTDDRGWALSLRLVTDMN